MDNTLLEINKHKFNIAEFSQKLIRTFDLNDEMFITNEIKKEIEFLFSLYNIKNNIIKNQMPNNNNMNNMNNFFNPLLNPNFNYNQYQQILQQQMMQFQQAMQQQEMMMRQQMENIQKEQNQNSEISVLFYRRGFDRPIEIRCSLKDKCSDIFRKYKNLATKMNDTVKFIFNAKALPPSLTVEEAGITHNSNVFVVETNGVRGG